MFVTLIIYF